MTWRFRRSLTLFKGVRINFGKRGASLSLGGRGLSLNLGRRGRRATVGLPGSGLSYSTRLGKRSGGAKTPSRKPGPSSPPASARGQSTARSPSLKVPGEPSARPELDDDDALQIKRSGGTSMTEEQRAAFVDRNRQAVTAWLRAQAAAREDGLERGRAAPERPNGGPATGSNVIVDKPPVSFADLLPEQATFAPLARLFGAADARRDRVGTNSGRMEDWRQHERERWRHGDAPSNLSALSTRPLSDAGRTALQARVQASLDAWLQGHDVAANAAVDAHATRPESAVVLRVQLEGLHALPQTRFRVDLEKPGLVPASLSNADKNRLFRSWALRAAATVLQSVFRIAPAVETVDVRVDAALPRKKGEGLVDLLHGEISREDYVIHLVGWDGDEVPHRSIGNRTALVTCEKLPNAVLEAL